MFKTSSTNQRDIKLVTTKFAITEGIIRQAANVSTVVILVIREGSANTFTSTSEMELLPAIIMVFNVYLVAKSSKCSRVPGLTLYKWFAQASWIKLTNTVRKGNNSTKQGWQISILQ